MVLIVSLLTQAIFPMIAQAVESETSTSSEAVSALNETNTSTSTEISDVTPTQKENIEYTGTSSIETGVAVAGLTIENQNNTNTIENFSSTTTATSTPPTTQNEQGESEITDIDTNNLATTTTKATSSANTGNNHVLAGNATINTGDVIAYADITNVVNTTINNSDGLVQFINDTLGYKNFDLRPDFEFVYDDFETSQTTNPCETNTCNNTTLNSNTDNTADINNTVTVIADSGNNSAVGNQSSITTGDAYASANIINVANTNITDSNYLLLMFNNFSDYAGDIVLPNSVFFDQFLVNNKTSISQDTNLTNVATVLNTVTTVANTGNNTATNNSSITTGDSYATSDVTNILNQNIIGTNSFSMLIRVHGDWSGRISGLPDGLTWRETERGIEIISTPSGTGLSNTIHNLTTNNSANIRNDVQVYALTGDNQATVDETTITTGKASADSAIINIANTNIIGSNWSNLIFTIYGNWSGNLAFGQPDLWLGISAKSVDQPIMANSKVDYTFTIFNHGDKTAEHVSLESIFDGNSLAFSNQPVGRTNWDLGDIKAGETKEMTYRAVVSPAFNDRVVSALPLTARVTSLDNDSNNTDNEDTVTVYVGEKITRHVSNKITFPAKFDIKKTADKNVTKNGDIVTYTITFFNRGGQLFDALLVDSLSNEDGEEILTQSWPLGEIKNWETITISYSVLFDEKFSPGVYTNRAQLVGFHGSLKTKLQTPYESPIATYIVRHGLLPVGQVLGASTSSCSPYLTDYIHIGHYNKPTEVTKLQIFLNEYLGTHIPITGFFGQLTEQAVRQFQRQYSSDILDPWGLTSDTGYVYYTTQKKINELVCEGTREFPLELSQQAEIDHWQTIMN